MEKKKKEVSFEIQSKMPNQGLVVFIQKFKGYTAISTFLKRSTTVSISR